MKRYLMTLVLTATMVLTAVPTGVYANEITPTQAPESTSDAPEKAYPDPENESDKDFDITDEAGTDPYSRSTESSSEKVEELQSHAAATTDASSDNAMADEDTDYNDSSTPPRFFSSAVWQSFFGNNKQ